MLKLFSIFIKNINNRLNFLLIIKKLDLSTLSTLLSTLEPKKGSFFKHAQPQTKKLCAYKKKVYIENECHFRHIQRFSFFLNLMKRMNCVFETQRF